MQFYAKPFKLHQTFLKEGEGGGMEKAGKIEGKGGGEEEVWWS